MRSEDFKTIIKRIQSIYPDFADNSAAVKTLWDMFGNESAEHLKAAVDETLLSGRYKPTPAAINERLTAIKASQKSKTRSYVAEKDDPRFQAQYDEYMEKRGIKKVWLSSNTFIYEKA